MKKEVLDLAKYRLSRSEDTYNDGCILFERSSYDSAVNRFYYAAFYAARALLATKDLDSSKHSGVITLFQQHFVKTGVFADIETAKVLSRSFEKRQDSDYEDFAVISKEEVESLRNAVRLFIDRCGEILGKILHGLT